LQRADGKDLEDHAHIVEPGTQALSGERRKRQTWMVCLRNDDTRERLTCRAWLALKMQA
jgi:hypothetical protein